MSEWRRPQQLRWLLLILVVLFLLFVLPCLPCSQDIFSKVDKSGEGVCVQASTLGSLEALLSFLDSGGCAVFLGFDFEGGGWRICCRWWAELS